jgi:molybdate transport system substrate-binding protein
MPCTRVLTLVASFLLLAAGSCAPAGGEQVLVFAATSLEKPARAIAADLERERPGLRVEVHAAGSQILAAQVREGARADVVITADEATMKSLADAGLVGASTVLAQNALVVAAPLANPAHVDGPQALARPGVKVVLAAEEVPAGRYARAALDRLGLVDEVLANVVSLEENVGGVLTKVRLGEADAGVVYASDVVAAADVVSFPFPAAAAVDVRCPIALMRASSSSSGARAFVDRALSPAGQERLRSAGFLSP